MKHHSLGLLCLFGLALHTPATDPEPPVTYESIVARAKPDPEALRVRAELERRAFEVRSAGGLFGAAPEVRVEAGPRSSPSGSSSDRAIGIETPLLLAPGTGREARSRLEDATATVPRALEVESRLRLRTAYLDAWFAQERLDSADTALRETDRWREVTRVRIAAGAQAPYEQAIVDGEALRLAAEADDARRERSEAWGALRTLAELPESPQRLAPPGTVAMPPVPEDWPGRCQTGLLGRSLASESASRTAAFRLSQAAKGSRWALAGGYAQEADERFYRFGVIYKLPRPGERGALARETDAGLEASRRENDAVRTRLEARCRSVGERVSAWSSPPDETRFDTALRALESRMTEGRDTPSAAIPARRLLIDARLAALRRLRDGHLLAAELAALSEGS